VIQGSGFRVQDSRFRVQGSGLRVQGSVSKIIKVLCRIDGLDLRLRI